LDAIAGRALRSRLDAIADSKSEDPARVAWAKDLRHELDQRFNEIAPAKITIPQGT
jgi:hypothetical protein